MEAQVEARGYQLKNKITVTHKLGSYYLLMEIIYKKVT